MVQLNAAIQHGILIEVPSLFLIHSFHTYIHFGAFSGERYRVWPTWCVQGCTACVHGTSIPFCSMNGFLL